MKIYLLDLGYMELDANVIIANTTKATMSNPHIPAQWVKIPIIAAVIITDDDKIILYDCGSNYAAMNGYWTHSLTESAPFYHTPEQKIRKQLALCGLTPENIDTLILSHMHLDHMGNVELFKNCKIIMVYQTNDPDKHGFYIKSEVTCDVNEYQLIKDDYFLYPGIELIRLPGHSAGMLDVKLCTKNNGTILLVQDACYSAKNFGPPIQPSGFAYDYNAYFSSIEKIHAIVRRENAMTIFGHDMEQFMSLKRAPEFYD
jgi:glyoxylase-like metal-dependent hydrolase (beta-lactamase superfamily II)